MLIIRGKHFTISDIEFIKQTLSEKPTWSRRELSLVISQRLNWRQPNGNLKDRACRDVLLHLEQKGMIHLPPPSTPLKRSRWA
jgi:hypothetical protein